MTILLGAQTTGAADKWALLVGVSEYINGSSLDLKGPDDDVQMMEELLLTKFGYDPSHIRKLQDAQATKAAITSTIRSWLATMAKPGDTALFYYSGHGSQIWDQDGDEQDGQDEVLCPADVTPGTPGNELSDDELAALLRQVKATDLTVILDACHAGTGARELDFGAAARPLQMRAIDLGYPKPAGGQRDLKFPAAEPDGMDLLGEEPGQQQGTRALEGGSGRTFTLIAACAPNETSASTEFCEGATSSWYGVLTYNLAKALRKADSHTTYQDLMAGVLRDVKKVNAGQTPQVEGAADRPIFSNTSGNLSARQYVRVTAVQGNTVDLRSSSFGRDQVGSIYKVLSPTGGPAGRIKLTRAMGVELEGQILEGQGQIAAGALAQEEYHATSPEKLQVRLGNFGDESINQAMRERLERLDFVQVVKTDSGYFDQAVSGRIEGSVLSLLTGYDITAWLEEGGTRSREVTSVNVDEIIGVLRPLLENAYAIKKLTRMDNDSPPFRVSVWATKTPSPGKKQEKFLQLKIGDPVYFHFRSGGDAYLTLLNVGADGSITILFPNEYMPFNRVVANKVYTIPSEEMGFQLHIGAPGGQEMVKAFATEFPMDLSKLNAQAVGGFRALDFEGGANGYGPSVADKLGAALNASFAGNVPEATRAIMLSAVKKDEGPPPGTPTENWSTDYVMIESH